MLLKNHTLSKIAARSSRAPKKGKILPQAEIMDSAEGNSVSVVR
jgi:hypothetical protein